MGLTGNDTVDGIAKAACTLDMPVVRAPPSLRCYKNILFSALHSLVVTRRDTERANSVSIQHYDSFLDIPHKYRRHGLMVRRHSVVSARLRLGYRPVWQVSQAEDVPHYSTCRLCHLANANTLQHYCLACSTVRYLLMLPQDQDLISICKYLLQDDNLDLLLIRFQ